MTDYNRFQRLQRKQDNVNQVISAQHDLTPLQSTVESVQLEVIRQKDTDFLQLLLFALEHNPLVNSLWVDLMDDATKIDLAQSLNGAFTADERGWAFSAGSQLLETTVISKAYAVPTRSMIKKMMLVVSSYVPTGSSITYEVSSDGHHWHPIAPSTDNLLTLAAYEGNKLRIRGRMVRGNTTQQPILYGWALLFYDQRVGVIELEGGGAVLPPIDGEGEDPLVTIGHNDLVGIGPDDHHDQEHSHDGIDGSGQVSHTSLLGMGPDDHHSKDHRHAHDGLSPVVLEHDIVGTLPIGHHHPVMTTGFAGQTVMTLDLVTETLTDLVSPDSTTILQYDDEDRLAQVTTIYTEGSAKGHTTITTLDYDTDPPIITTVVKDAQGFDLVVQDISEP
jgi:hypothetical protein